jgi:hypothetical protein
VRADDEEFEAVVVGDVDVVNRRWVGLLVELSRLEGEEGKVTRDGRMRERTRALRGSVVVVAADEEEERTKRRR